MDGTPNRFGKVDHATDLTFRFKRTPYTQAFYVIDLGKDHMILGMPFLSATSPTIDWTKGMLQGKVEASTIDAYHKPLPDQAVKLAEMKKALKESHYCTILAECTNQEEDEEPLVVRRTTKSTTLAADAIDKTKCTWQEQVPTEYHKYGKVFSEEALQRFPDQRPWDHAIDLVPDALAMLDCKTYPLTEGLQPLLDEFIAEYLKKGYICPFKSLYALPFFFIKKKDDKQ